MRYATLKDGYPHYAPSSIILSDRRIINPTPAQLMAAGYLPVITTDPPETDAQHYAQSHWAEADGQIVQSWTVEPLPPDPEQETQEQARAYRILMGLEE